MKRLLSGVAAAACLVVSTPVVAQRTPRLPDYGRPVASTDNTIALGNNPANLAYLPGTELRWTGIYLQDDLTAPTEGHSFSLATWVPFLKVATGFRFDLVSPPTASALPDYQWLTWGLAFRSGSDSALGFSLQTSFSDSVFADDLTSLSLAYSTRPFNGLGISLVAHDVNSPANPPFSGLGRSYDVALAIRPTGTRAVEVGLEGKYLEIEEDWVPRATLGIDVPHVGRVSGELAVSDPTQEEERAWLAAGGLSFFLTGPNGSAEFTGGTVTGNALGQDNRFSAYSSVATRSFREPVGIEPSRYGVRIRLESTPDTRTHVAFLRQLWSLAEEPNIDAVVFELRASPGASLARIEELRDAVYQLRRAGKRTLCHLEDGNGGALFFCAATNRVLVNPSGGVRFSGMRSQHLYFARLLDKLGIRAEFVRAGGHKSAPEQFTRSGSTEISRADKIDLLQQFERGFSQGIAVGRNLTVEQVRETIGHGPFIAEEAKQYQLVDGYAFDDQLEKAVRKLTGRNTPLRRDDRSRTAPETFGDDGLIALVYVDGDIIDGRNRSIPFFGMSVTGSYTIAETLKAVRESPRVEAVVIRVESPGGSSMASDVIWREVQLTAKAKPTVISMGSVAASGGYYLAAPATRIFANPMSVTGSIGVFAGKADLSELLSKIGVDVEVYKTHPRADAESFFRPFTEEEREELGNKVDQFYELFLKRVAKGRNMTRDAVHEVAQGRVWTGEQAKARGLVDELGGLRQALEYARQKSGLGPDTPIVELPRIDESLLARLLGVQGLKASLLDAPMPDGLTETLRALAPFVIHAEDKPLARMEFVLEDVR